MLYLVGSDGGNDCERRRTTTYGELNDVRHIKLISEKWVPMAMGKYAGDYGYFPSLAWCWCWCYTVWENHFDYCTKRRKNEIDTEKQISCARISPLRHTLETESKRNPFATAHAQCVIVRRTIINWVENFHEYKSTVETY